MAREVAPTSVEGAIASQCGPEEPRSSTDSLMTGNDSLPALSLKALPAADLPTESTNEAGAAAEGCGVPEDSWKLLGTATEAANGLSAASTMMEAGAKLGAAFLPDSCGVGPEGTSMEAATSREGWPTGARPCPGAGLPEGWPREAGIQEVRLSKGAAVAAGAVQGAAACLAGTWGGWADACRRGCGCVGPFTWGGWTARAGPAAGMEHLFKKASRLYTICAPAMTRSGRCADDF